MWQTLEMLISESQVFCDHLFGCAVAAGQNVTDLFLRKIWIALETPLV
jgi:hypothetical protein